LQLNPSHSLAVSLDCTGHFSIFDKLGFGIMSSIARARADTDCIQLYYSRHREILMQKVSAGSSHS
jgi:hypothetical protein